MRCPSSPRRAIAALSAFSIILSLFALAGGTARGADKAAVEVEDGNVFILQGSQRRQLTRSGRDAEPALSPDGRWVVFTRVGNSASAGEQGDCKSGALADELRRIQANGTGEELLVRGQEGKEPEQSICGFYRKQFSSDGRMIYFLSPAWATSSALHIYDTRDKARRYVMAANDVIVLNECAKADYRDSLIVQQHRYFVAGGSYDWYWLYDRTGRREIGPLGDYEGEQGVREAVNGAGLCDR